MELSAGDEHIYHQWLLEQADIAWETAVPEHDRTGIDSLPNGQMTFIKVRCRGTYMPPSTVEIVKVGKIEIIKGICSGHCGANLRWEGSEWIVEEI